MGNISSSTAPSPAIVDEPFDLTVIDDLDLFEGVFTLSLGSNEFTDYSAYDPSGVTFHSVTSSRSGDISFTIYDTSGNSITDTVTVVDASLSNISIVTDPVQPIQNNNFDITLVGQPTTFSTDISYIFYINDISFITFDLSGTSAITFSDVIADVSGDVSYNLSNQTTVLWDSSINITEDITLQNIITSTLPVVPIQNQPFSITLTGYTDTFNPQSSYSLLIEDTTYTNYTHTLTTSITFYDIYSVASGVVSITLSDLSGTLWNDQITVNPICYAKGTQILCYINKREVYINIEDMKKGTLVKTYKQGYKTVVGIISSRYKSMNTPGINSIYKLPRNKMGFNKPFKDLYVTGSHSILVDLNSCTKLCNVLIPYYGGHDCIVDKYKLLASECELFDLPILDDAVTTYQFALENKNTQEHYGVYANGILSESMNIDNYLKNNM